VPEKPLPAFGCRDIDDAQGQRVGPRWPPLHELIDLLQLLIGHWLASEGVGRTPLREEERSGSRRSGDASKSGRLRRALLWRQEGLTRGSWSKSDTRVVDQMQEYSRQHVIDLLNRMGYRELADEASRVLPDPVDIDRAQTWLMRHGLSHDDLVNRMGGSP
jgi:hypothetical protein